MLFFRLRITCFLEIHMAAGTPWLISMTLPMVHLLLRMPHRCMEFTKWSIEWLEELSNKVVNKSYKINKIVLSFSYINPQYFFNLNYKEYFPNLLETALLCAKFLFFELETSNFGYLLIFKFPLTVQSFSKIGQHWY